MINHKEYLENKLKDDKFKNNFVYEKSFAKFVVAIQKERINQGLSQADLAKKAKITQQQLSNIENGANFTIKTLVKLFQVLGLTLSFNKVK